MPEAVSLWLQLAACLALMGLAGPVLSRNADVIADKTGLSGNWVGLILLATVTSLPELITGASAVVLLQAADIAAGDVFGSCVVNLAMLAVLDFLLRDESVYRKAGIGHVLSAGFGVVLISFAALNITLHGVGVPIASHLSLAFAPVTVLLYALSIRAVFTYERTHLIASAREQASRYPDRSLRDAILRYAAAGSVVVMTGVWLPFVAQGLAGTMGWSTGFVSTLLVAAVTSMPELVVTVAAIRIGAVDMAIANLLGSNLFNMVVLAIDDVLYTPGPLLADVSPAHVVSALSAVTMSGIVILGLVYRPEGRIVRSVGWIGLTLFMIYLLNAYAMFLSGQNGAGVAPKG